MPSLSAAPKIIAGELRSTALLVGLAALLGCAPDSRPGDGHGLLVIALDGLRADRVHALGYDRETTPFLDDFAADCVLFDSVIAGAPQFVPAHVSLLTGCDPNLARREVPQWMDASLEQPWFLPPAAPRLALSLATEGWRTLAISGDSDFSTANGFGGGFQDFREPWKLTRAEAGRPGIERGSRDLQQWLRGLGARDNWFAYVHASDLVRTWDTWDPEWDNHFEHRPELRWVPPTGTTDPSLFAIPPSRSAEGSPSMAIYESRFDGQMCRVDQELRAMFDALRRSGRWENTTIAVVGSFGMQFGEAGLLLDHGRLSMADLRVPLWLRVAPSMGGADMRHGERDSGVASSIDLAPTLLDLCGLDAPSPMQGRSLRTRMEGGTDPRGVVLASCGIQAGILAIDDQLALEVTLPNVAPSDPLVRAWYGDDLPRFRMNDAASAQAAGALRRTYAWREDPFPALDRAWPDQLGTGRLLSASQAWLADADALRRRCHADGATVLTLLELEALVDEVREAESLQSQALQETNAPVVGATSEDDEQP